MNKNNFSGISGTVIAYLSEVLTTYGVCYETKIKISKNGKIEFVKVRIPVNNFEKNDIKALKEREKKSTNELDKLIKIGDKLMVIGTIITQNITYVVTREERLNVFVNAEYARLADTTPDQNESTLVGKICSQPLTYNRKLGKEISKFLLAVDNENTLAAVSYIPCNTYLSIENLEIGTKIRVTGNLQDVQNQGKTNYEFKITHLTILK